MRKVSLVAVLFLLVVSCNYYSSKTETALVEAGANRAELEKVLDFYSKNPADSLKYKAAVFLIENLPYRFSYKRIREFDKDFELIDTCQMTGGRGRTFISMLKSTSENEQIPETELLPDCEQITSQFLTNNIEFSFKAWATIPQEKRASFNDFCNFILPYKSDNEPIEENAKQTLAHQYAWVYSKLNTGVPLPDVVEELKKELKFLTITDISKYYPQPLGISQTGKSRIGLCSDGVNYLVTIFRSLGIVSAADLTPHWGNHPALGHSWLYVKYGDEEYATDVRDDIDLKKLYANESIAKAYRKTYSYHKKNTLAPLALDVTNEYVTTTAIAIPNTLAAPVAEPVLCVFDYENQWDPISVGTIDNNNFTFTNIGTNVLYMAASQEDGKLTPINYPFFIDQSKKIHFYKPDPAKLNTALLTRKCRLSSPRNKKNVLDLMECLDGALFQGANKSDFSDAETFYKSGTCKSSHLQKIQLQSKRKFKYVRFYANGKKAFLARLAFYGSKAELLTGEIMQQNVIDFKLENSAFDDDPLTFTTGIDFSLGYAFDKPQLITAIEYQRKNDMNHIVVGNEYELFYWNKQWKTLGVQIVKDTLLQYPKVPDNALFWLRNNTAGKEEQVFIIDKNRKQYWLGSDN